MTNPFAMTLRDLLAAQFSSEIPIHVSTEDINIPMQTRIHPFAPISLSPGHIISTDLPIELRGNPFSDTTRIITHNNINNNNNNNNINNNNNARSNGNNVGLIYTGELPLSMWIQREQQRVPSPTLTASDAESLRQLGNRAFSQGNYNEAINYYTQSIQNNPTSELAYTNRSFAYYNINNYPQAASDAREAIKLNPRFFKGFYRLGMALMGMSLFTEAQVNFNKAIELADTEESKEKIRIALAKCESKMVRTPATPLLMGSSSEVTRAPSFSSITQSRLINYDRLGELIQRASTFRSEVNIYKNNFLDQKHTVECQTRAKRVKSLMHTATSSELSALTKEAAEQQEALRRCLKSQDRLCFQEMKLLRDQAYQALWDAARNVSTAIEQLDEIAKDEQDFFKRFGDQDNANSDETYSAKVSNEGPFEDKSSQESPGCYSGSVERTTSIKATGADHTFSQESDGKETKKLPEESLDDLLSRQKFIAREIKKVDMILTQTDTIAEAFLRALEDEAQHIKTIEPYLIESAELNKKIEVIARHVAHTTKRELSAPRLDALKAVKADVHRITLDEKTFKENLEKGNRLLSEEAQLEKQRLVFERQRIQLNAEIEWLKVSDEPERKILAMRNRLAAIQKQISDTSAKQQEVQKCITDLIEADHPELALKSLPFGSRILKMIKGSGLWLNLSFSDFQIVSTLSSTANSKVYLAKYRGAQVALKEVQVEDPSTLSRFKSEVNIVAMLQHPNILRINGVFFDGPFAYVMTPYYPLGSLKNLLANKKVLTPLSMQDMLRQMVSALSFLHERGIVHADIKPSNILVADDNRPIIADFGIAKDVGRYGECADITVTQKLEGTANFMAPEQFLPSGSGRPTTRSDMWSMGLTMYFVASQNARLNDPSLPEPAIPVLIPPAAAIPISSKEVGGDEKLADLIASTLVRYSANRPTAHELLSHPYFSVSFSPTEGDNSVTKSDKRLEAFRSYLHMVRMANRRKILISVSRIQMVDSVNQIFSKFNEDSMLSPLLTVFQGEEGIDEGALTTEMLNLYYEQLVKNKKALVREADDSNSTFPLDGANESQGIVTGVTYLPAPDSDGISEQIFECFGRVLMKNIIEGRPLPLQLNAALVKFLCGVPASLMDLEEYDKKLADSLKRYKLLSSDDLADADMDFSDMSKEFLETHMNGVYSTSTIVDQGNVKDYVELRAQYFLIGQRRRALETIKKGFFCCPSLAPHTNLLQPTDLILLLCGQQHISPATIIDCLEFQGFSSSSQTPAHLKELIMKETQNNLRRFLQLCTSSAALPLRGVARKIKVLCCEDRRRLPVGHGCARQLDLPDYNDKKVLKEKMHIAFAHISDGFHIA